MIMKILEKKNIYKKSMIESGQDLELLSDWNGIII
jgi:hypothetical protein